MSIWKKISAEEIKDPKHPIMQPNIMHNMPKYVDPAETDPTMKPHNDSINVVNAFDAVHKLIKQIYDKAKEIRELKKPDLNHDYMPCNNDLQNEAFDLLDEMKKFGIEEYIIDGLDKAINEAIAELRSAELHHPKPMSEEEAFKYRVDYASNNDRRSPKMRVLQAARQAAQSIFKSNPHLKYAKTK
jgi:hypothetical protein